MQFGPGDFPRWGLVVVVVLFVVALVQMPPFALWVHRFGGAIGKCCSRPSMLAHLHDRPSSLAETLVVLIQHSSRALENQ